MATGEKEDNLQCGLCFELYTEDGDNTPKILPCGHTVCSKCLISLKQFTVLRNNLPNKAVKKCPFCSASFDPQKPFVNNYIIDYMNVKRILEQKQEEDKIKRWRLKQEKIAIERNLQQAEEIKLDTEKRLANEKKISQKLREENKKKEQELKDKSEKLKELEAKTEKIELCPEHHKELGLFCKEEQCDEPICTVCLTKNHVKHEVVDLQQFQKESWDEEWNDLPFNWSSRSEFLEAKEKRNMHRASKTIQGMKKAKGTALLAVSDKFDAMMDQVRANARLFQREIQSREKDVSQRADQLWALLDLPPIPYAASKYKDFKQELSKVRRLKDETSEELGHSTFFPLLQYEQGKLDSATLERVCGSLREMTEAEDTDRSDEDQKKGDQAWMHRDAELCSDSDNSSEDEEPEEINKEAGNVTESQNGHQDDGSEAESETNEMEKEDTEGNGSGIDSQKRDTRVDKSPTKDETNSEKKEERAGKKISDGSQSEDAGNQQAGTSRKRPPTEYSGITGSRCPAKCAKKSL